MSLRGKIKGRWKYLLLFLLLFSLGACSGVKEEKSDKEQKTESSQKEKKKSGRKKEKEDKEESREEKEGEEEPDQKAGKIPADHVFLSISSTKQFHHLSKGENIWYYGEYPILEVKTEGFEELQKTLDRYNKEQEEAAREGTQSLMEEYPQIEISPDEYLHYTLDASVFMARADDKVLSFTKRKQIFLGSEAQTEASYTGVNIEAKTGKMLEFGDIVKDIPACMERIKEEAAELYFDFNNISEETLDRLESYKKEVPGISEEGFSWFLDYEGIGICLNLEMTGVIYPEMIYIPYRGNEELFHEEYFRTPERYLTQLVPDTVYILETEEGMKRFKISHGLLTEAVMRLGIENEDNYISELAEGFSAEAYLLHTDKKQNLLYYLIEGYNDRTEVYVYDLNDKEFNRIEVYYGKPVGEVFIGEERREETMFINPDRFRLLTFSEILGSCTVTMDCHLDEEGKIKEENSYYDMLQESDPLILKKELSVNSVDEEGNEGEEILLLPGESLEYVRTDMKSYVDMRTSEGKLCRIRVKGYEDFDQGERSQSVNGELIEDYFEGIVFAN